MEKEWTGRHWTEVHYERKNVIYINMYKYIFY